MMTSGGADSISRKAGSAPAAPEASKPASERAINWMSLAVESGSINRIRSDMLLGLSEILVGTLRGPADKDSSAFPDLTLLFAGKLHVKTDDPPHRAPDAGSLKSP